MNEIKILVEKAITLEGLLCVMLTRQDALTRSLALAKAKEIVEALQNAAPQCAEVPEGNPSDAVAPADPAQAAAAMVGAVLANAQCADDAQPTMPTAPCLESAQGSEDVPQENESADIVIDSNIFVVDEDIMEESPRQVAEDEDAEAENIPVEPEQHVEPVHPNIPVEPVQPSIPVEPIQQSIPVEPVHQSPRPAMAMPDPKSSITINEKFTFVRELFNNERAKFDQAMNTIRELPDLNTATDYVMNTLGFDFEKPVVNQFMEVITRFFNSKQ